MGCLLYETGDQTKTQTCALTGNGTGNPSVFRMMLDQPSHSGQESFPFYKEMILSINSVEIVLSPIAKN